MKLIQLNVWGGRLTKRIVAFLEEQKPDVVCMQEVFSSGEPIIQMPDNFFNNLEQVAGSADFQDTFSAPLFSVLYGNHRVERGNAMVATSPLRNRDTLFVKGTYQENANPTDPSVHGGDGPYNLQLAEIEVNGQVVTIANYHGYWQPNPIGNQTTIDCIQQVADRLKKVNGPVILAGDLNVTDASPAMRVFDGFLEDLTVTHKIPSTLGKLHFLDEPVACDHVLISPEIKVRDFQALDPLASDHQALILEFDI